jgi:hypothetical protein
VQSPLKIVAGDDVVEDVDRWARSPKSFDREDEPTLEARVFEASSCTLRVHEPADALVARLQEISLARSATELSPDRGDRARAAVHPVHEADESWIDRRREAHR